MAILFGITSLILFIAFFVLLSHDKFLMRLQEETLNDIEFLGDQLTSYSASLESIYSLPQFYGDKQIKDIINLTGQLKVILAQFKEEYDLEETKKDAAS